MHAEGLHAGQDILDELDARFDCQAVACGPYFFAGLAGTSEAGEQAAIDSGLIQANRIQYAGRRKSPPPVPQRNRHAAVTGRPVTHRSEA